MNEISHQQGNAPASREAYLQIIGVRDLIQKAGHRKRVPARRGRYGGDVIQRLKALRRRAKLGVTRARNIRSPSPGVTSIHRGRMIHRSAPQAARR